MNTVSSMGGKNPILVLSHLISGSIIFALGLFLIVYHFKKVHHWVANSADKDSRIFINWYYENAFIIYYSKPIFSFEK